VKKVEFISNELKKLDRNEYDVQVVETIFNELYSCLSDKGVVVDEPTCEQMYLNHLLALSKRISKAELVEEMDLNCLDEISEDSWQIAEYAVSEIFAKYDLAMNKTECFLIATHIEINKRRD
jgi:PRD domain protein (TIGR03582 family)